MTPRRGYLVFDQVEVVEQPMAGGGDTLVRGHRGGELAADLHQGCFVGVEPGKQRIPRSSPNEAMPRCEDLAVALDLVGAEQFGSQRRVDRLDKCGSAHTCVYFTITASMSAIRVVVYGQRSNFVSPERHVRNQITLGGVRPIPKTLLRRVPALQRWSQILRPASRLNSPVYGEETGVGSLRMCAIGQ